MLLASFSILASLFGGRSLAASQQLQEITNFGPFYDTQLKMGIYVPPKLLSNPSVLLALHGCGGSGPGFFRQTSYAKLADVHNVILIFPSSPKEGNCWDGATNKTLTHGGHGDSEVLINMVDYIINKYGADPSHIFLTGSSSGCMMSNVVAGTYPDRIAAVSCYSGIVAGCFVGQPGSTPITSDGECFKGNTRKTGEQWAAIVRSFYPGYKGKYPRFLTWHGTADGLVSYQNLEEQLKLWSTINGVDFTRNTTEGLQRGYTRMVYGDGTKIAGISAVGVGHVVPTHEMEDFKWFGLL